MEGILGGVIFCMKWFTALVGVLLLFSNNARADATLYGAWYTVAQSQHDAPKDAGGVSILLRGDIDAATNGPARFIMTVNSDGTQLTLFGSWVRARNGRISVMVQPSRSGDPDWRGTFIPGTSQCSGTWKMDTAQGRFLARKE